MSFNWIDKYVNGIIDYCYSRDIFEIYSTLDMIIRKIDKDNPILRGNDAIYLRNYFDEEIVFIRDDLPYQCEKFVLSHELGHAILHTDMDQAAYNSRLINRGKLERQADYFACRLLGAKIDDVYHYDMTSKQMAGDLCVREECLEYL